MCTPTSRNYEIDPSTYPARPVGYFRHGLVGNCTAERDDASRHGWVATQIYENLRNSCLKLRKYHRGRNGVFMGSADTRGRALTDGRDDSSAINPTGANWVKLYCNLCTR
ncbi:hypothetical protein BHE74_00024845 [Ensete ventricosum]|nr:hypothetical protein BHE74_00024845 [Ensete ventricosum]